jgi:hypothetical protein
MVGTEVMRLMLARTGIRKVEKKEVAGYLAFPGLLAFSEMVVNGRQDGLPQGQQGLGGNG